MRYFKRALTQIIFKGTITLALNLALNELLKNISDCNPYQAENVSAVGICFLLQTALDRLATPVTNLVSGAIINDSTNSNNSNRGENSERRPFVAHDTNFHSNNYDRVTQAREHAPTPLATAVFGHGGFFSSTLNIVCGVPLRALIGQSSKELLSAAFAASGLAVCAEAAQESIHYLYNKN